MADWLWKRRPADVLSVRFFHFPRQTLYMNKHLDIVIRMGTDERALRRQIVPSRKHDIVLECAPRLADEEDDWKEHGSARVFK